MSSRVPNQEFSRVPKSMDQGRSQPREAPGQRDSSKEEPRPEDESDTNNTDQDDARRFHAYREHRYGQSSKEDLDLLQKMDRVQDNGLPWYLDRQPVGITRPGAFRSSANAIPSPSIDPGAVRIPHSTNMSTQASAAQRVRTLIQAGNTAERGPVSMSAEVAAGWEIEFLVPLSKGDIPHEALEDGRYFISEEMQSGFTLAEGTPARVHIADILKKAGIPTIPTEFNDPTQAAIAASYLPDPSTLDVNAPYGCWKVVPEIDGMTINARLAFDYVGLELNSRPLPANVQAYSELDQVLRLIRNNVLVSVTDKCGVHVHVDASALDLNEQRHFLCLYIIVEKVLFSLCHPRRGKCTWCRPVYVKSHLALEADRIISEDDQGRHADETYYALGFPEKMRLIHGLIHSLNTEELLKAVRSKGSRNALTLKAVGQDKYTFEFRHFQGSFDSVEIRQWTRICLALVMAAKGLGNYREHPASQVYDVFYQISCRPEDEAWRGLLIVLGLADAVHFWEKECSDYPSPQDGGSGSSSDSDFDDRMSPDIHLPRVG